MDSTEGMAQADAPTLAEFLGQIERRIGTVQASLVRLLFARWGGTVMMRRRFRRHGMPLPSDWYDLWLQLYAQSRLSPVLWSARRIARVRGISTRALTEQSHHLFQMEWAESVKLPWQARIECFLRHAGLGHGCIGRGVRRSRFNDVNLRTVGNRAGPGAYIRMERR